LHGYFYSGYSDQYLPITNAVAASNNSSVYNLSFPKPPHGRGLKTGNPFLATNLLSELDQPGEYYAFPNATLLFIPWSTEATDKDESSMYVSVAPFVLQLRDTSHITLSGLHIAHARGTGILGSNLSHVSIRDCVSELHGEDGIRLDRSRDSSITDSSVANVGCVGVALSGGNTTTLEPGNLLMEGCKISNFSQWKRTYRPGLAWAGVANTFRSNVIENGPHSCVLGGGGETPTRSSHDLDGRFIPAGSVNTHFINNTFWKCAYECADCGAWYSGSGHSYTDVNNSLIANHFIDVQGGIWAEIGQAPPSTLQVHAICKTACLSRAGLSFCFCGVPVSNMSFVQTWTI
jgi:hypothetical protein